MSEEQGEFKHDVAFSFLAQDLTLATRFADALMPLTSFVFSREQEDLAGTDGQESFRAAFRFDSRLNVILLRDRWGQTAWTRVEKASIQERCLEDGWDRLLVVNLDGSKPPAWLPAVNLYLDLETFPIEQAIGVIKRKVQELGGDVKPPSRTDIARAKLHTADFERETKALFKTPEGIQLADQAVIKASDHLYGLLRDISDEENRDWSVVCGRDDSSYGVVRVQTCSALFNWNRYANDCNGSELTVRVFRAAFETPEEQRAGRFFMRFGDDERAVFNAIFEVTRHPALGVAWTYQSRIVTSEDVAEEILAIMINVLTSSSS
jgi:hypothetical protein